MKTSVYYDNFWNKLIIYDNYIFYSYNDEEIVTPYAYDGDNVTFPTKKDKRLKFIGYV